jgi:hypothetical protein
MAKVTVETIEKLIKDAPNQKFVEPGKVVVAVDWDKQEKDLIGNFISLMYSPNPVRDRAEIVIDGETKLWIARERFVAILKETLDYSQPRSRDLIAKVEVSLMEYGGWFEIERDTFTFKRLQEIVPNKKLVGADVRTAVENEAAESVESNFGVESTALAAYKRLLGLGGFKQERLRKERTTRENIIVRRSM